MRKVPVSSWILQFRVALQRVEPEIWRRFQVAQARATFWTLHCAIQDCFGWLDYHLHEFLVPVDGALSRVGIPDDDGWDVQEGREVVASWDVSLASNLPEVGHSFLYRYDFGDQWRHTVTYEGRELRRPDQRYPVCVGGARACPPEDCGGPHGYERFLAALRDPRHPDSEMYRDWLEEPFDPEFFDAGAVDFSSASRRLARIRKR